MARKRKPNGGVDAAERQKRPRYDEKPGLVRTYEDVADSEDEFHIERDKIMLAETPAEKRSRALAAEQKMYELSDEEVLPTSEEDLTDEEGLSEDEGGIGKARDGSLSDTDTDERSEAEDEETGGWGTTKKDYYNTDVIETEQDALEEETEARRLQQLQLQGMTAEDFGLDDEMTVEQDATGKVLAEGRVHHEKLPDLVISDDTDPAERMRIMRIRYPEFELLAKEYVDHQALYEELSIANKLREVERAKHTELDESFDLEIPLVSTKYRALNAYRSALAMYFVLLSSGGDPKNGVYAPRAPEKLRTHPIMDTLIQCRDLWLRLAPLEEPKGPNGLESQLISGQISKAESLNGDNEPREEIKKKKRRNRKNKTQRLAESAQAEAESRRLAQIRETEASLADLASLTSQSKTSGPSKTKEDLTATTINDASDDSDIGDQTSLTAAEAAEKAQRNKSLRFYTSQIAQKANKRGTAGRDAGGDADLPYKERSKDRQVRLGAEAEARGKKNPRTNDQLDSGNLSDSDANDKDQARTANKVADDEYYDFISSRTAAKKSSQAALDDLYAQAKAEGGTVRIVDPSSTEPGPEGGKRAISYAIEKNKGLHPRRKKDVRNPRVKKRKKFEEKKKKLGSIKQVYKGGEGRGGYGGEATGIKKNLVRAVQFS